VLDANSRALVNVYARETTNEANIAGVLMKLVRDKLVEY
jgi:hypothetical protein